MKIWFSFSSICLVAILGFGGASWGLSQNEIPPEGPRETTDQAPPKRKTNAARVVLETLVKELLRSVRKDNFYANLSFDFTIDKEARTRVPQIDVLDLSAWLQFKNLNKPIEIPIFNIETPYAETDRKLSVAWTLKVSDLYGMIQLHRGSAPNSLEGQLVFMKGPTNKGPTNKGPGGKVPTPIHMSLSSELLDIKELWLYGINLKLQFANPTDDPEKIKSKIISSVFNCRAESEVFNIDTGQVAQAPLDQCQFSFDGRKLRIQYREAVSR